ncbi:hypothetical protein TruAng_011367 [Truncatella angustata]|nr:hypothetical protein TruAng_011367 [Truncatella angustata]
MLRGLDPEVDNNIWLQWTNPVPSMTALAVQGSQSWSRERSKHVREIRAKDKDALPWLMIYEKPAAEGELPSALVPNDDYFRTANGKARYPAIDFLNIDKVGGAVDTSRTVSFEILLDEKRQGE